MTDPGALPHNPSEPEPQPAPPSAGESGLEPKEPLPAGSGFRRLQSLPRLRIPRHRIPDLILWGLLIAFLLVPAWHFLRVSLGRLAFPYEIEWLEGEVAMASVRFADQASIHHLYPPYGEDHYVPILYPPLYQMVVSVFFRLFSIHLVWGRLISLLSTLGILAGTIWIVRHHTRRWLPGILGALTYLMYFKASGFWYDLVRVDSFAYCLAIWSVYFILAGKGWRGFSAGLALALLIPIAKQTALFLPVAALGFRVAFAAAEFFARRCGDPVVSKAALFLPRYRNTLPVLVVFGILAGLLGFAVIKLYPNMIFYVYKLPGGHHIFWERMRERGYQEIWQYYSFVTWIVPAGLWLPLLTRRWPWPRWKVFLWAIPLGLAVAFVVVGWIAAGRSLPHPGDPAWGTVQKPGLVSIPSMRYVASTWTAPILYAFALSCGALAVWVVRWVVCKTPLHGIEWFFLLFAAQHVALLPWMKIGGYINNFMPIFIVQGILAGIAVAWMIHSARGRWWRHTIPILLLLSAAVTWYGTRPLFLERPRLSAKLEEVEKRSKEKGAAQSDAVELPRLSFSEYYAALGEYARRVWDQNDPKRLEQWRPWVTDGLRYHFPRTRLRPMDEPFGNQLPQENWRESWKILMERVAELNADGGVYLPHQNYLGLLAGVEPGISIDAVRDIALLGRPTPEPLLSRVREGYWKYIILDHELPQDWSTGDFKAVMSQRYEKQGLLAPGASNPESLMPRTGARVRPTWVYVRKGDSPGKNPVAR